MRITTPFRSLLPAILGLFSTTLRADAPFLWGVSGTAGVQSTLYAIHPVTGTAIEVGPVGRSNVSGISVNPTTGVLYATQGQLGGTTSLLTLSKVTGAATTIGDLGESIADTAFSPAGVFYIYGANTRELYTVNLATAAKNLIKMDAGPIGGCGITFDLAGDLFMTRSNSIADLNPATGNVDSAVVITGSTTNIDNLFTTRSDGVFFGGARNNKAAPTSLYTINSTTGVTTLVSAVPLSLSGLAFDVAPTPFLKIKGSKTKRTSRKKYTFRGTYTSNAPATISGRKNSTEANSGPWSLTFQKLKPGTNRIKLICEDAAGQTTFQRVKVIVE